MGLRTAVRNLLKKVFGDSLYREFGDAYRNVLYGDDREGLRKDFGLKSWLSRKRANP